MATCDSVNNDNMDGIYLNYSNSPSLNGRRYVDGTKVNFDCIDNRTELEGDRMWMCGSNGDWEGDTLPRCGK